MHHVHQLPSLDVVRTLVDGVINSSRRGCLLKAVGLLSGGLDKTLSSFSTLTLLARSQGGRPTCRQQFATMGGATIGAGRDMSPPPLLRDVPRRGYNPIYVVHLRGTTAGR